MLISGTSHSIGRYTAEYYLKHGFTVIGCSRKETDLQSDRYQHFILDITDETLVRKMFMEISKKCGRLDVLVNNAAVQVINSSLLMSAQGVNQIFNVNLTGAFLLCREAAKIMKTKHAGRIINVSSVAVPLASIGTSIYGASKAALEHFSRVFAKEMAGEGITVNILGLSIVKGSGMASNISETALKETLRETITGKETTFEEITHALDFLISDQSSMVTGQTIYLGGV
jgi:3-oxoacyl-[acyl-carrier protein] reductase